jgi:hypothetical protein
MQDGAGALSPGQICCHPSARSEGVERGVTHIRAVGGGDAYYRTGVLLTLESVQLRQQLIQRLLPLIVAHAAQTSVPPCATSANR